MQTHFRRRLFIRGGLLGLAAVLAVTLTAQTDSRLTGATTSDCVGKPYASPGCPTRPVSSAAESSVFNTCGNAIVEPPEQCDKGRFNGKTNCSTQCKDLYCGDGVVSRDITEECEPQTREVYALDKGGNLMTEIQFIGSEQCGWYCQPPVCTGDGSCTGGCKLKYIGECTASGSDLVIKGSGSTLSASGSLVVSPSTSSGTAVSATGAVVSSPPPVQAAVCGDRQLDKGEECDDGNTVNDDACTSACKLPRCGDGIRQAREACDAGTRNSDTTANVCRSNCVLPGCGDGVIDKNEQCDAGSQNSDTNSNVCRTTCRLFSCGDGIIDANEECDDRNALETDECTTLCKKAFCGDGILQTGEQCDWGAKNSDADADACRKSCKLPRCGDKVTDTGEECDGGKECGKDCKLAGSAPVGEGSGPSFLSGLPGGILPVVLSLSGVLLILTTLLFRRRIVRAFTPRGTRSIDDIPLDQIEMPWHKW